MNGGYKAIFSNYTSNSAGVAFLFNKNFKCDIIRQFSDPDGRFIFANIQTSDFLITLVNIYAPNSDDPDFFKKVADHITNFRCEEIVIGGDFNLTLNVELDKVGGRSWQMIVILSPSLPYITPLLLFLVDGRNFSSD